jgi:hypothetical protein
MYYVYVCLQGLRQLLNLYAHTNTHIHAYVHTDIHICTYTRIGRASFRYWSNLARRSCTCTYTYTHRHTCIHTYTDVQITEQSFFPILVKLGEEVMNVTGVDSAGEVLLVRRNRSKAKDHACGYVITCIVRLSGEPTSYAVRVNLAGKLQVKGEAITADPVATYMYTADSKKSKKSGDVDFEVSVCVDALNLDQAESVRRLLVEEVFPVWVAAAKNGDKDKSITFGMVSLMCACAGVCM